MVCRRVIRHAAAGLLLAAGLLAAGCIRGPAQPVTRDAPPAPTDARPAPADAPPAPADAPPAPADAPPAPADAPPAPADAPPAPAGAQAADGHTEASVVRAVDGDTLVVAYVSGAALPSERVRLIGVDTPESTTRLEPFGREAAEFTAGELTGRTVWLTRDVSDTDRYGRALRFVWLVPPPADPTDEDVYESMFNAILVRQGYASSATFPPDVRHADLFRRLERQARAASVGLWGPETAAAATAAAGSGPGAGAIGGSGGLRYDPAGPDRDCGDFATQAEAQAFFLAAGGPGADSHRLDRDRDGLACESLP